MSLGTAEELFSKLNNQVHEPERDAPHPRVTSKGKAFLVMDRDATYLNIVNRYLMMDGAQSVLTTKVPEEGLSVVRMANPEVDCIICAEDLALISGIEILKNLRSGKYGDTSSIRSIKFVMLTAHREMALVAAAKALDADGYILKPINFNSFVHHLHGALAHTCELRASAEYLKVDIGNLDRLPIILTPGH